MKHKDILYYKDSGIRTGRLDKIIKHKDYPEHTYAEDDYDPEREIVIYLTSKESKFPPWDFVDDVTTEKI
jgi:hypothetical protein